MFNNPASLKTGLLAEDFRRGKIKYLTLGIKSNTAEFNEERLPRRELIMGWIQSWRQQPFTDFTSNNPNRFPGPKRRFLTARCATPAFKDAINVAANSLSGLHSPESLHEQPIVLRMPVPD